MLRVIAFIVLLLFDTPYVGPCMANDQITAVSLIQLTATPEKYNGKRVRLTGYLHVKFEDSALYLSKDDADYLNAKNALWVEYSNSGLCLQPAGKESIKANDTEYFDCKMVLIEGTFDKDSHGHMGLFSGTLKQCTRILEWTRWYDGSKKLR